MKLEDGTEFLDRLKDTVHEQYFEIERLNKILEDIEKYIRTYKIKDITEKTMLVLNDILLIKNGMSSEVIRLKEK